MHTYAKTMNLLCIEVRFRFLISSSYASTEKLTSITVQVCLGVVVPNGHQQFGFHRFGSVLLLKEVSKS